MGRGLLTFKGDAPKRKSRTIIGSSSSKHWNAQTTTQPDTVISDNNNTNNQQHQQKREGTIQSSVNPTPTVTSSSTSTLTSNTLPVLTSGGGHVTTSGIVVTGHDTNFEQEFSAGDAMMIGAEMRVVTMRLSNTSCGISSAFSKNHSTPTTFSIIKKPTSTSTSRTATTVDAAQIALASSSTLYREKTEHGSYRLTQIDAVDAATRSDLLHLRAKKTSDKYC